MLEFVERNNAADKGRKADPATKVLGQMVLNELHDMLHWLVVAPAHFDRYRDLWNRFCDEQNAPQHKIASPKTPQHRAGKAPSKIYASPQHHFGLAVVRGSRSVPGAGD